MSPSYSKTQDSLYCLVLHASPICSSLTVPWPHCQPRISLSFLSCREHQFAVPSVQNALPKLKYGCSLISIRCLFKYYFLKGDFLGSLTKIISPPSLSYLYCALYFFIGLLDLLIYYKCIWVLHSSLLKCTLHDEMDYIYFIHFGDITIPLSIIVFHYSILFWMINNNEFYCFPRSLQFVKS